MNNIIKSLKLDNYILKNNLKAFSGVYLLAVVITVITKMPALGVGITMLISAPVIGLFFSIYEKNNLNKLYGILPVQRSEVVTGRFLYALIFGVINEIVSGVLAYVVSLILNYEFDRLTYITILSATFFYYTFFISILFPVYFRFSYSKVYIFTNLPIYLTGVLGLIILRKTNFLKNMKQTIDYLTSHQEMIWIIGIGAGLILLCISCLLSYIIYKEKEF